MFQRAHNMVKSENPTAVVSRVEQQAPASSTPLTALMPEIAAILVVLVWASTFILSKNAYEEFRPLAFAFVRFIGILVVAFGALAIRSRGQDRDAWWTIERADVPRLMACGVFGYTFYQLGFTLGLAHTSPFSSSLMIAMMPLVSLVIVAAMGERQSRTVWVGAVIALAGVAIFLSNRSGDSGMLGNVLSFGAAVSFAFYGVVSRPLVKKYRAETFSAYSTLAGAIPLLLVATPDAMRQDWSLISGVSWLVMAYMIVFPVYLAYIMWNWAIEHRGIAISGWNMLVPVVSGVLAALFYGESFGPVKLIGGALALFGLILMRRTKK
jgi:drug/metabolite transporter (DMT)-like permease